MKFVIAGEVEVSIVEWSLDSTLTEDMTVRANGIAVGYFSSIDGSFGVYDLSPGRLEALRDIGFRLENQSICMGGLFL